jgi:glycosyltransferase 2 family protein
VDFVRRHRIKLIASIVITIGVVWTAEHGGIKILPDGGDFSGVRWWALVAYVPTVLAVHWFRSVRWRFLLRSLVEVRKLRLFAVSSVGMSAVLLLPFRLGELVRPYMLRTPPDRRAHGERALTMTAATTSIVAERIFDGLYLSTVLAIVLVATPTIVPMPDHVVGLPISVAQVRGAGFAMLGLFGVGFVTIAVFYFARGWAHRATHVVVGRFSPRLAEKLAGFAEKLADGLRVFSRGRDALGFFVETSLYWGLNSFGMWILAIGCGITHGDGSYITFPETCACLGLLGCAVMVPGPPGMLGLFQVGLYAAMTMYFPTSIVTGPGAAYVFLLYITQFSLQMMLGAWGLWYEGGTQRLRSPFKLDENRLP